VDIGGSGIKGAPVDLDTGELLAERVRIPTPQPATPEAVGRVVAQVLQEAGWEAPFGATFPAVIDHGVARTAANVASSWVGTDVAGTLSAATGQSTVVLNDADAAGLAEVSFGGAAGRGGTVLVLTFGTGIGSALFVDRTLVPNTELGHLELDGVDAEHRAADSAREREDLSWPDWAARVERYLRHVDLLLHPDVIVLGGGVSKKAAKWLPLLQVRPELTVAALLNTAGIVGAAMAAANRSADGSANR
jgi:polyphosphate glucokinase